MGSDSERNILFYLPLDVNVFDQHLPNLEPMDGHPGDGAQVTPISLGHCDHQHCHCHLQNEKKGD